MKIPKLKSKRLLLSEFKLEDADKISELAGDKRISDTTLTIPYPYPVEKANEWINTIREKSEKDENYVFAIRLKGSNKLIGAIGIAINKLFNTGEIGYWIGVPYWNNGFVTEAISIALQFGFMELNLHKIHAHHLLLNEASGKVMIKNGMKKEGIFKQHVLKNGKYHDAVFYGILKSEYLLRKND